MATIREIKDEIQFSSELRGLLEIMKNIAIFKFRSMQKKKQRFLQFSTLLKHFFGMIDLEKTPKFLIDPEQKRAVIVMITSNEGFMGGLNLQVINWACLQQQTPEDEMMIVGERGAQHLRDLGKNFVEYKSAADSEEIYNLAEYLKKDVMLKMASKRFGQVIVVYPNPVSFMVQRVEVLKLLPVADDFKTRQNVNRVAIVESPEEKIVEYLIGEEMLQRFLDILEDSKLAEFSARAIHLEKSSQELLKKEKKLRFQYFRAYHEIIDENTRELFQPRL